jgi:hypothetical protein
MKKTVLLLLTLCLMLTAAACSTPTLEKSPYEAEQKSTDIEMTVNEQTVAGNAESVSLTIKNASDKEYTYGAASTLEVEKDGTWYVVEPKEDIFWIEIAYIIAPGETNEESVTLNEYYGTLESGSYRIVKTFTDPDGNSLTAFGLFAVE